MITVTDNWKALHLETFLPKTYIEVSYFITEPGLVDDVTSSATLNGTYSEPTQIKDFSERNEPLFATFEKNAWVLDGRFSIIPSADPYDVGYWSSALSQSDGTFTTNPVLTLQLGSVHSTSIPGVTITFAPERNEWASDFIVRAYNDVTLVKEIVVSGNPSPVVRVWSNAIVDYDKVTVEIVKWSLPDRYPRIMEVALGLRNIYTKADLFKFEHTSSANLSSAELPKNAVMFKLENTDGKWNPSNPSGLEQYLIERQTIRVRYGFKVDGEIEWINAGVFYMSEWDTPSNGLEATFVARDMLEFMGDAYVGTRSGTLTQIAEAVLLQAEIDSAQYSLTLPAVSVDFSSDTNAYTCAEVLQLCAHAGECVMFQNAEGVLVIAPLDTSDTDYEINRFNSYSNPEYSISKELKSVDVNEGLGEAINGTTGEILTSENPIVTLEATADSIATWLKDIYSNRKTIKTSFRPDPRLEVLDKITVISKYVPDGDTVYVTEVKYTFNGAFRATVEGRVM